MILGNIIISEHAIQRYRQRVVKHRQLDNEDELTSREIKKMIYNDLYYKNIREIIKFKDDFKFVFTRNNCEFRLEKSADDKSWVMLTVVRYKRMFPHEEPQISDSGEKIYGIRHEIDVRKKQKLEYEVNKK